MKFVKAEELVNYVGKEVGVSDWCEISQDRINQFADVTEDHQYIHVDPEAAKASPFGTTVAHGFLTLSMLSKLAESSVLVIEGVKAGVNYGFDKVRFITPVKSGKRIRGRFKLMKADQRLPGQWAIKYAATVEIEGEEKLALVAEWLTMQIT
ncbi:MAG: MaoC family dehydratase [Marinicaulis sp.]|nr:MaoC family dehydratase [Marinicaulis sp.]NNE39684.1 MaoC family dehydratase [Marinicaulis sp.]NNL90432.1 MaoC family dehydratase [Marinicaulis sp.]